MERVFCYTCGGKLSDQQERSWYCKGCKQRYYDNPRPTADIILFDEKNRVLLVKRAFDPGKGKWDLPGGFLEFDETFAEAALREVNEELGVRNDDIQNLAYCTSYTAPYPFGIETYHNVSAAHVGRISSKTILHPQDDVADHRYYTLEDLEGVDWSFPPQKKVVLKAAKQLGIV